MTVSVGEQDRVRLNALLDGELDTAARAELLDRVANEPSLARELSALGRLKSVLADSMEVPDIPLPAPRRRRPLLAAALAAGLALAAVTSLVWLQRDPDPSPGGASVAWAVEAHRAWTPAPGQKASEGLMRPARAAADAYVPDLSAARLFVAYVGERQASGGGRALVVGYSGTRGCRLTLVVSRAAGKTLGDAPAGFDIDGVLARGWRVGEAGYIVLADGMGGPRFALIADSVYRASLERLPLDGPTRMHLARSRARSEACRA